MNSVAEKKEPEDKVSVTPNPKVTRVLHHTNASDKTKAQHAENIAYTINHALACTATDFIDPFVSTKVQKYLNQKVSFGCGHDHSKDGDHGHGSNWQGVVGELAGDFGAVPVTVLLQHYAPWFMDAIRWVSEPIMGDLFRNGAKAAATHQSKQAMLNGTPFSPEEYRARARELYHYEIQHLPQGLVWTVTAVVANVKIQKHVLHNPSDEKDIYAGKITGALVSSSLLFGTRAFATDKAKKWDEWATTKVFMPMTKSVGKWFGVEEKDVNSLIDRQKQMNDPNWQARAKDSQEKTVLAVPAR